MSISMKKFDYWLLVIIWSLVIGVWLLNTGCYFGGLKESDIRRVVDDSLALNLPILEQRLTAKTAEIINNTKFNGLVTFQLDACHSREGGNPITPTIIAVTKIITGTISGTLGTSVVADFPARYAPPSYPGAPDYNNSTREPSHVLELFGIFGRFMILIILATWFGSALLSKWLKDISKYLLACFISCAITIGYILTSNHSIFDLISLGGLSWCVQFAIYKSIYHGEIKQLSGRKI
jgi:hypothetical protein